MLNSGVPLLPCGRTGLVIKVLVTSMLLGLFRLLDRGGLAKPLPLVKGVDLVALAQYMICTGGRDTVRVTKVEGAC